MNNRESQGEEKIGKLIAAAGPGPSASAEAKSRVYAAVHASWQESLRHREEQAGRAAATRRAGAPRYRVFGLAATVVAAALILYWFDNGGPGDVARAELAQFARIEGSSSLIRDEESLALAAAATAGPILAGDMLRTGSDGQLALRLDDGLLMRVNVDTELVFVGADAIELVAGTVYVDSGPEPTGDALAIRTPIGSVTHLGTQYEVHFADSGLRLRVREGSVRFNGTSGSAVGAAGEQLEIDADGASTRSALAPDDAAWRWATALATLPEADEYRIGATLAWLAREQGLRLEYAEPATGQRLASEVVVGLGGLNPVEALEVLARTTDLDLAIEGGRLRIAE